MRFKKGDKVFFIGDDELKYAWKLDKNEEYEICDMAYKDEHFIEFRYGVKPTNKNTTWTTSTWYNEEDFITLKEYRKLKLQKLHGNL